ncbi:ATP-binding cassette domain-containing protein [Oerskovia sp. Sa1BUA8]|uniref:ATP-binding cassette domain-containing protein n=1 Tax=Oerskovia douganii TaxID=2762210 RepID=A0A9D5Z1H0_9CELL|nr:ATP-binding cassette domain-containing protein [Oerskovia douganii]
MSLALDAITFKYRGTTRPILAEISLEVPSGTSVALMAPSGAGKSTLLSIAGLLLAPDSGSVAINGTRRSVRDGPVLLGKEVGWILQSVNLLARRSALDNVALPRLARGARRRNELSHAEELLGAVGLHGDLQRPARKYSGGEAQRIGVARALMSSPAVLIADEPTANLDLATARDVARALFGAARERTALLIATHDEAIASMADRVITLETSAAL